MERLYLVLGLPPGSYMTAMESICYRPRSTDTLLEQLTPMPQWLRPAVSVGRAAMRGECSAVDTGHKAPLMPGVSLCSRPVSEGGGYDIDIWRPQPSRHPHSRRRLGIANWPRNSRGFLPASTLLVHRTRYSKTYLNLITGTLMLQDKLMSRDFYLLAIKLPTPRH
jgi:hypothetical protein